MNDRKKNGKKTTTPTVDTAEFEQEFIADTFHTLSAADCQRWQRIRAARANRVKELVAGEGPDWEEKYRPGSMGCHELLDRVAIAADALERHVLSHPSCVRNPDWYELADRAAAALHDLYQRVGGEHETGGRFTSASELSA